MGVGGLQWCKHACFFLIGVMCGAQLASAIKHANVNHLTRLCCSLCLGAVHDGYPLSKLYQSRALSLIWHGSVDFFHTSDHNMGFVRGCRAMVPEHPAKLATTGCANYLVSTAGWTGNTGGSFQTFAGYYSSCEVLHWPTGADSNNGARWYQTLPRLRQSPL